jgi:hypothetical protein
MKTKIINDLTQYTIPDGEGFSALPIAFLCHCAHYSPELACALREREEDLGGKE